MARNPEEFRPTASRWFTSTLKYVGRCRAEFSDPWGSIEGLATVLVDEAGDVSIEMIPEASSLRMESSRPYELMGFLSSDQSIRTLDTGSTIFDVLARNPCTGIEVTTSSGTFSTTDVEDHGTQPLRWQREGDLCCWKVHFRLQRCRTPIVLGTSPNKLRVQL